MNFCPPNLIYGCAAEIDRDAANFFGVGAIVCKGIVTCAGVMLEGDGEPDIAERNELPELIESKSGSTETEGAAKPVFGIGVPSAVSSSASAL